MRLIGALCSLVALMFAPAVFAQELTTKAVLDNMDKRSAVFSTLQATVKNVYVNYGVKQMDSSGSLYMQIVKGNPRVFWDVTIPKDQAMRTLIQNGKVTVYWPGSNSFREQALDPKSEALQYLLIGFGSPSANFTKGYKPELKARENMNGISTVVLELTSTSSTTKTFPKVTLWLDPATWTPVQTRLTEVSKDSYKDFKYSNVKLNKGLKDSDFNLKVPGNAGKQ